MVSTRNGAGQGSGHGQLGPTQNEPITRAIIAEEVTKAIQAAIPAILEQMNENTRQLIEDRIMAEKKYFSKYKLAEFTFPELHEICDPIAVMRWIREMESIFDATKCADVNKVEYAIAMMKAEALIWWDMVKETNEPETAPKMTWSQFKQVFKKKLFPRTTMLQLEKELMTLEQESQTVREYTTRFLELASIADDLFVTEEMKIDIYIRGLNPYIGMFTGIRKWTKLQEAVQVAIDLENNKNREFEERNNLKRKQEDSESTTCTTCGKSHEGECRYGSKRCYRCGEPGHFARACPSN